MLSLQEQYVAWVNSQLKKRPNSRFVREIPRDTRDGVALVQLVEVLGQFYLLYVFVLTMLSNLPSHKTIYEKCDNIVWSSWDEVSLNKSLGYMQLTKY